VYVVMRALALAAPKLKLLFSVTGFRNRLIRSNMGGLTTEYLDKVIRERLNATHVEVNDQSGGCGQAFEVIIVSDQFVGKNKLFRHRLVNKALHEEIAAIHAFTQVSGLFKPVFSGMLLKPYLERIHRCRMGKTKIRELTFPFCIMNPSVSYKINHRLRLRRQTNI
jgi:stress-induced morphogen